MTQKKNQTLASAEPFVEGALANDHRYRTKTLPSAGMLPRPEDTGEQLSL